MNIEELSPAQNEKAPEATKGSSFSEQLLAPSLVNSDIPYEIRSNQSFVEQVASRKKLVEVYAAYTSNPDDISSKHKLYQELSKSFGGDASFGRAALYVPFSLLPNISNDQSNEAQVFTSSYKKAFNNLLTENAADFRADFLDGDVLEPALRDGKPPEQIIKAPHLLPWLMRNGIFSQEEVITLVKQATNPVLIQSLSDVLPVLYRDLLVDDQILDVLTASPHQAFRRLEYRMKKESTVPPEVLPHEHTPKELLVLFTQSYQALQKRISSDKVSPKRIEWQLEIQGRRLQDEFASKLAPYVQNDLDTATLDTFVAQNNPIIISLLLTTLTMQASIEFENEGVIHTHTEKLITHLLSKITGIQDRSVLEASTKLQTYVHKYGADIKPHEKPQFMESKETPRTTKYLETLASCAHFIEEDPLLSQCLYPVTLSLGSHAKGYAKNGSDIDMGVFVKAGTSEDLRKSIQEKLEQMSRTLGIHGSCMEFWLQEDENGVIIKNYENPDQKRGDSVLTHPLTGSWVGNLGATKKLRQRLMRMYLESEHKLVANRDARGVWLKDIEHNILQYRLMHKGYASHMPPETTKKKPHHFSIDGESMFYDEGYRKVAFDLYLKKVFLPVVSEHT
jgi:hypothetical protein